MDFGLTNEQEMIIESVKSFVEKELYPFEDEVEKQDDDLPKFAGLKELNPFCKLSHLVVPFLIIV